MNRSFAPIPYIVLVLLLTAPARAWNHTGHMTVALIAYRQLVPAQQARLGEILTSHPHYQHFLVGDRPDGLSAGEWAFLRAAIWPDYVRPTAPATGERFKGPEITRFHRGGWHAYAMPWVKPADRKQIDVAALPGPRAPHLLGALAEQTKTLASVDAPPADRAVAAAWIAHLIGDLHQPLHACTAYSAKHPDGDNVGSQRLVRSTGGEVIDLHRFWDRQLGTSDSYTAFDFLARSICADPRHAPDALKQLSRGDTPADWANESFDLAVAFAHLNGRLDTAPMKNVQEQTLRDDQVPAMPSGYAENARVVSNQRIAQAGYRLGATLKAALSAAEAKAPAGATAPTDGKAAGEPKSQPDAKSPGDATPPADTKPGSH